MDFGSPTVNDSTNASDPNGSKFTVKLFLCPSDSVSPKVPGSAYGATNYVACSGSGSVSYGDIATADGAFAQTPVRIADVTDGLSNTAAFSETVLGGGVDSSSGAIPSDAKRQMLIVNTDGGSGPGSGDPTPAACAGGAGSTASWSGQRAAKWINGHYGDGIYNHAYLPNATTWDCSNGWNNKGAFAAQEQPSGGSERRPLRRLRSVREQHGRHHHLDLYFHTRGNGNPRRFTKKGRIKPTEPEA